jgi:CheY-like chemotaxis protein
MFICLIAFGQDHSDSVIVQENNINLNDQILMYQEFLREETKLHREYTQEYYSMIRYVLSGLGIGIGIILAWLNWRSKKDIRDQVNQQFRETFEGILNEKISQLDLLKERATKQFEEINKMILELSAKSNIINKRTDKNFGADKQIDVTNLKGKKILWVDDYPGNNDYLREILEQAGIKFNLALDTSQAVNILKKEKFDLIISDMGRGDNPSAGLELLTKLKGQGINTPAIIFSSTQALRKFGNDAMELGASALITGFADLLNIVQKLLNNK